MPSNKDLTAAIAAIDSSFETSGLNNNQLVKMLSDAESDIVVKESAYEVSAGKSILTKRGILSDGDEITNQDLPSDDVFEGFIKSGHISKS